MKRVNEPDLTLFELRRQGYGSSQVGNTRNVNVAGVGATAFLGDEICRVQVPDDAACDWVVTLAPLPPVQQQGPITPDQGTPQIINDAFAIVEWGVGKGRSYAVVDWSLGQSFSVFGSYVSVKGVVNSLGAAVVGPAAVTSMSAFITPGHVTRFPSRTLLMGALGAGGGTSVRAVPPFSRRMWVTFQTLAGGDPTLVNLGLFLQGRLTTSIGTAIWTAAPGVNNSDPVPPMNTAVGAINSVGIEIPLGTNFIALINVSTIAVTDARIRCDLVI